MKIMPSFRTYVRLLPVPGPEHSVLISALRDLNDEPFYAWFILLITASPYLLISFSFCDTSPWLPERHM
jgi:hypothetical protein